MTKIIKNQNQINHLERFFIKIYWSKKKFGINTKRKVKKNILDEYQKIIQKSFNVFVKLKNIKFQSIGETFNPQINFSIWNKIQEK